MRFITIQQKSLLATAFVQGKSNQETFTHMRSLNQPVTYEQVVKYREHQQEQFNQSFDQIFKGAFA
jgi:hypothetical protein